MASPMASGDVLLCVECEDQSAAVQCLQCDEPFCRPCFQMQHRKGKRRLHNTENLLGELMPKPAGELAGAQAPSDGSIASNQQEVLPSGNGDTEDWQEVKNTSRNKMSASDDVGELIDYIPLRLTERERNMLAVLDGALRVSEYTDEVDTYRWGREDRMSSQLDEMFDLLVGLLCCNDFKEGSRKGKKELTEDNEDFFQEIFEIGRRYKIMNPEKMRSIYGKLMYMVQDAVEPRMQRKIRVDCMRPIATVGSVLQKHGLVDAMLKDEDFSIATAQLCNASVSSDELAARSRRKQQAIAAVIKKFSCAEFPSDEVERIMLSVSDSKVYQSIACAPIKAMIRLLKTHFGTHKAGQGDTDLNIRYGHGGSQLSHNHSKQYGYVLQSLTLWLNLTSRMFYLWRCADNDLLSGAGYRLCNTGQGLNRVQACPSVSRATNAILRDVQAQVGGWIGLSVVHLGDRDVPNALMFIDKYTQVPRILAPIVQTVERLDELAEDPAVNEYFKTTFGGVDKLRIKILSSFFKHGFDGSGDDGGSCIDGRLTSAWNWCSKLEKKTFYRVFLLAGFVGFDGDWRQN
eukprot:m.1584736 g.1584736  ORF g.1584736 m.1584736 type:complete len:572 (-) comp25320_c0_seq67:4651-6366(-)